MWQYELHQPHLIIVATLPWESQNIKNVILQQENCITCIKASSKWTRVIMCFKFTYLGVIQQGVYETIHNVDILQKAWCKLGVTLTSDIINAVKAQRHDRLRWRVCAGGGHFEHMLLNERSFIWFIRTFYETGNIIWCMCEAGKFIPLHTSFILKSNNKNCIKIRYFLTKLHRQKKLPPFEIVDNFTAN